MGLGLNVRLNRALVNYTRVSAVVGWRVVCCLAACGSGAQNGSYSRALCSAWLLCLRPWRAAYRWSLLALCVRVLCSRMQRGEVLRMFQSIARRTTMRWHVRLLGQAADFCNRGAGAVYVGWVCPLACAGLGPRFALGE